MADHQLSFFRQLLLPYLLFFGLLAVVVVWITTQLVFPFQSADEVIVAKTFYQQELVDLFASAVDQQHRIVTPLTQLNNDFSGQLGSADQLDIFSHQSAKRVQKDPRALQIETNLPEILSLRIDETASLYSFLENSQGRILLRTAYKITDQNWAVVSTILQDELDNWHQQHQSAEFWLYAPKNGELLYTTTREYADLSSAYQFTLIFPSVSQQLGVLMLWLPEVTFSWTQLLPLFLLILLCLPLALFFGYLFAQTLAEPFDRVLDACYQLLPLDSHYQTTTPFLVEIQLNHLRQKLQQAHHLRRLLSRYVGHNIATQILMGEQKPGGYAVWATVFFADIRDFTALTEKSDITDLFNELNDYFTILQKVIEEHGGVINKFGGDSVLALFGGPQPLRYHGLSAVRAACEVMDELAALNQHRLEQGRPPFRIGIGVNTGEMAIGNLGSSRRLEYTALGDCVNAAKRLSDLSKETPFYSIFAGEASIREMEDMQVSWQIDNLGEIYVKGKQQPITTYAVTPDESHSNSVLDFQ